MPFKKKSKREDVYAKVEFYLTHMLLLENLIKYFQMGNFWIV